ncbi:MAG: hypothetical protein US69_C0007G0030 [candidate division TM6 bacterium GW2011_GWF2_38_10]|nr:MAG: hypothetical protein US69_C0007G0030 [candidate division TM6 bacterium GW2011_GWF2_38_10]
MKIPRISRFLMLHVFFFLAAPFFISADTRINLFLKHPPQKTITESINQITKEQQNEELALITKATDAQTIKKKLKQEITYKLSGFFATYAGYTDTSNPDGLISFPLRHSTPKLYLAITPSINLVKVKGKTISHREYIVDAETKMYLMEQKTDEHQTTYWEVSEQPLPENRKVNPLTLIIFANPQNIIVPTGTFLSEPSSHLILPELYVVGDIQQGSILLKALDLKRFFEKIREKDTKQGENITQTLITNM